MSHCPNCGSTGTVGDSVCRRCGTLPVVADGGSAIDDENETEDDGHENQTEEAETDSDETEEAETVSDETAEAGTAETGTVPDEAGEYDPATDGVNRREMLVYSGGSAALTLGTAGAGWYAFVYEPRPPEEEVVRDYVDAIDRNHFNTAVGLFHEDSPHTPWPTRNPGELSMMDLTVESTEVGDRQEETERESVQEYALVVTEVTFDSGAEQETFTVRIVVAQNEDGEWRIWRDE